MEKTIQGLRAVLAGAAYHRYIAKVQIDIRFDDLSVGARVLLREASDLYDEGLYDETTFLGAIWSDAVREAFFDLEISDRMEVCGFLTCLLHERVHDLDMLLSPFGVNFHTKLARERLAFERHTSFLVEHRSLLNTPLADWLSPGDAGIEAIEKLLESPQGRAKVELRGSVAFDERLRGAPPRRVKPGWGSRTDSVTLAGHTYRKATVNQVWPTLQLTDHSYLGPQDVIEGRAVAVTLLYLRSQLGNSPSAMATILKYIETFYDQEPSPYFTVARLLTAARLTDSLGSDAETAFRVVEDIAVATWYALHTFPPVRIELPDKLQSASVLMSLEGRLLLFLRAHRDGNDWRAFSSISAYLRALDASPPAQELDYFTAQETIRYCIDLIGLTLSAIASMRNHEVRLWYERLFADMAASLNARGFDPYDSAYGSPRVPNPAASLDRMSSELVLSLPPAPQQLVEWMDDRSIILYGFGEPEMKVEMLRRHFM
jgi:hypothetical protein